MPGPPKALPSLDSFTKHNGWGEQPGAPRPRGSSHGADGASTSAAAAASSPAPPPPGGHNPNPPPSRLRLSVISDVDNVAESVLSEPDADDGQMLPERIRPQFGTDVPLLPGEPQRSSGEGAPSPQQQQEHAEWPPAAPHSPVGAPASAFASNPASPARPGTKVTARRVSLPKDLVEAHTSALGGGSSHFRHSNGSSHRQGSGGSAGTVGRRGSFWEAHKAEFEEDIRKSLGGATDVGSPRGSVNGAAAAGDDESGHGGGGAGGSRRGAGAQRSVSRAAAALTVDEADEATFRSTISDRAAAVAPLPPAQAPAEEDDEADAATGSPSWQSLAAGLGGDNQGGGGGAGPVAEGADGRDPLGKGKAVEIARQPSGPAAGAPRGVPPQSSGRGIMGRFANSLAVAEARPLSRSRSSLPQAGRFAPPFPRCAALPLSVRFRIARPEFPPPLPHAPALPAFLPRSPEAAPGGATPAPRAAPST